MKARRVVRARRPAPVSDPAPAGANPFAGFSLLQPQAAAAAPAASTAVKVLMARIQQKHRHPSCCVHSATCVAGAHSLASLHSCPSRRACHWHCRAKAAADCQVHRLHQSHHDHTRSRGRATRCHSRHGSSRGRHRSVHHTSPGKGSRFRSSAPHRQSQQPSPPAAPLPAQSTAQSQPAPSTSSTPVFGGFAGLGKPGGGFSSISGGAHPFDPWKVWVWEYTCVSVHGLRRSVVWQTLLHGCADMKQNLQAPQA